MPNPQSARPANPCDFVTNPDLQYEPKFSTEIGPLDHLLSGGFTPGLNIIGSSTGISARALCCQTADAAAAQGRSVLVLTLLESAPRYHAKSLASLAYRKTGKIFPAMDILTGKYADSPDMAEVVNIYTQSILPQLRVVDVTNFKSSKTGMSLSDLNVLQDILADVDALVIESFQGLISLPAAASAGGDPVVRLLKTLAIRFEIPVIVSYTLGYPSGEKPLVGYEMIREWFQKALSRNTVLLDAAETVLAVQTRRERGSLWEAQIFKVKDDHGSGGRGEPALVGYCAPAQSYRNNPPDARRGG